MRGVQPTLILYTDDHAGHGLLVQKRSERHLGDGSVVRFCNRPDHIHDVEALFLMDRRKVECGPARAFWAALTRKLSRKKSPGQRAPNQEAQPLALDQRNGLLLQIPTGQRAIGLRALERFEAPLVRNS